MEAVKNGATPTDAIKDNLKDTSVVLQDFVAHTDDASISVENFFSSVTGAGILKNAIKGIGLQMLTTAAQAAAIWVITEGFRLAVNTVQDYVNRAEIAKEKMENSKKAYRFTMTSTQKQTKKSTLRGKLSKCSFRKQSAN